MERIAMSFFRWIVLGTVICVPPLVFAQSGDGNLIFRLGVFDRSSLEFAQGTPKQPVHVLTEQSRATKDWYAAQPAASLAAKGDQGATSATSPRSIEFPIPSVSAAVYRLHISLLIEGTGVPMLRVVINGKSGVFYLHPKLDFDMGDQNDPPDFSHADVLFTFPGSYLHQGANTIALQAIEETTTSGATLTYDAIELERVSEYLNSQMTLAEIDPTVFYQQRQGQLEEMVNIFIRRSRPAKKSDFVDLKLAGKHYHQAFHAQQDFGDEKFEFGVSEFQAKTHAKLTWTVDGHREVKEQVIDPMKKWTVFLVPHIHLDVGYSDYQAKVAAVQSRAIDEAMDLSAQHSDFSFSLDGEWSLEQYLRTRSSTEQQRAYTAIRKRQLFVPAQYAELLTGFPTAETLIRSLYPSANFSRSHGTPFNYANITDVPSYSWSYPSILASAGIHDFIAGTNSRNFRAPVLMQGHLNEASPMWWVGPDGAKVLFWYSRGYQQMRGLFSLPPSLSSGYQTLPLFLQQYERSNYRANAVILYGTQHENTDLFPQQADLAQEWNTLYAYPRIQYSGFRDALENIAHQFGNTLPTIRGDGGPYWEDGIAADAFYAAMERGNESRGPSAEKLETLTSLVNPRITADKASLDRMWTNMVLMDEHTFASSDSVRDPKSTEAIKQIELKDSYATNAHALIDWMTHNSLDSIVDSITADPGSLVIFNTLNWKRSGLVGFDLSQGEEIVDPSTGQVIPFEVVRNGNRVRHVRFVAQDIPAVGYKTFVLRHAEKPSIPPEITHKAILENSYYRLELDPSTGAVRSIFDKQLGRELVNQKSPYRFGEYLYVSGGDHEPNSLLQYRLVSPKPNLEIHPAHNGQLVSVTHTPYGLVARMESVDANTPAIITEIRLFDREKKLEFIEDVDKAEVYSKEGVYFAFPFAMSHPQFQYEIQDGVVDPAKDMYPGAGHEWFSVQHWVSAQQDGISGTVMPLDASLVTLGDVNRGAWPTEFGTRPGTIFSYVMNNYWPTNYRAGQGGHFHLRYVVTSASSTNASHLSRMGWDEMTPLESDIVTPQDKAIHRSRPLNEKEDSFLDVKDGNLLLETWKPAEDGNGTILRFLDLGGADRTVTVDTPLLQVSQAWRTDAVERNKKQLVLDGTKGFQLSIHSHGIMTVRVIGKDVLAAPVL